VKRGNDLFWYILEGEPEPADGHMDPDGDEPGLGFTFNEESMQRFRSVE